MPTTAITEREFRALVAVIETEILDAEGPHHVAGRYFANDADARVQRRWDAERRARAELRAERAAQTPAPHVCQCCGGTYVDGFGVFCSRSCADLELTGTIRRTA